MTVSNGGSSIPVGSDQVPEGGKINPCSAVMGGKDDAHILSASRRETLADMWRPPGWDPGSQSGFVLHDKPAFGDGMGRHDDAGCRIYVFR